MGVEISTVRSARDLDTFLRLPWRIYRQDSNWVPPLLSSERKILDRARNPFWAHAEAEHFLARRGGEPVGRVSAILNPRHNEVHGGKTGFFGWFECEQDPEAAQPLLRAAEEWLRSKGMESSLGPANPSLNDTAGMLVDGYEWPPFILMTHNPRYYADLVAGAGYRKAMDLLAYLIVHTDVDREKVDRIAERVRSSAKISLRTIDMGRFEEELRLVTEIYNDAWEKNWGFVPMSQEEIRFAAEDMKAIVLPELVYFAEVGGEVAGFALALPNINLALKKCNGRLWPFGWFHFLKFRLRKIPTFRVVALGIRKKFQSLGLGTLFYQKYLDQHPERGYVAAEMSWILESNEAMNRPARLMGGKHYKTYRMYEKGLTSQ
ncbi:MAG: GNAT family N-acetyltransferase [Planctomycetes bacterium]|nr:GNAT family N-acetyltransferase [Planctomycetota bacterium]